MKRIHLFEFEDAAWLPVWLKRCIDRLILVMHNLLSTSDKVGELVARLLRESNATTIMDVGSGRGGPMPDVLHKLRETYGMDDITLILTDLYPDLETAKRINDQPENNMRYITSSVDATDMNFQHSGLRTMIGCFHHMPPRIAANILATVQDSREPICIFEISDNGLPIWLWWIAFPINFVMTFFITPLVRPMSWQQLFFTYIIPIIPICFAWDGAVSNARTYTLEDLDELLHRIESSDENYRWEKGIYEGKTNQLYLLGIPD